MRDNCLEVTQKIDVKDLKLENNNLSDEFFIRESADLIKEDVEAEMNGYSSEENMTGMD